MTALDQNIERAAGYMAHFREKGVLNHIHGRSVPAASGETFKTISPVDLGVLAKVARGNGRDIDSAAAAAKAAFPGWSKTSGKERRKILLKVADAIEARAEEIAFTECMGYRPGASLHVQGGAAGG